MKVLSISSYNIGALFIKLFTFSKWNHTAVMFSDGMVFDVTFFTGVRCMPVEDYVKIYKNIDYHEVEVPLEWKARAFAESQLGKKYDFTAIFGIIFQRRCWENYSKWFCSELAESIFIEGGKRRIRTSVNSVLPRESYAVV